MTMRLQIGVLAMWLATVTLASSALAVPAGPNGETCSSSATGVKRTIQGKEYSCDKCVFTKCDTSGGEISNCRTVTHYSNCVAALVKPPLGGILKAPSGVLKRKTD
ncbi:MAG: hypothetical protein ACRECX_10515 [Methyloceanibacter sp.]|uniref:hypothetical protein n=1 Tax=Methyloceanibacter sp. TaxID=1965321 RepID=UPI003D6CA89E